MMSSRLKVAFDALVAAVLLLVLLPLIVLVAVLIVLESPGPVFYRAKRVGYRGRDLWMLKFRKMHDGARGRALTLADDERFTRVGAVLAKTKLDELPQLFHVLRGEMSFIGPRPEDPGFVALHPESYEEILSVRPGITGLSQLAFARESAILQTADPIHHYTSQILPQKVALDVLYARSRRFITDVQIGMWTLIAVLFRREVAVCRASGRLSLRRRPVEREAPIAAVAVGQVNVEQVGVTSR